MRIGGFGAPEKRASAIVREAADSHVFGIEMDNDVTGMRTNVRSAVALSGNGWSVKGQVWPSPQKPYRNVSMYSTIGPPSSSAAKRAFSSRKASWKKGWS